MSTIAPFASTARVAFAALALVVLLSACTSTSRALPVSETPDMITTSDEHDVHKRARARMELASAYFGRGQMTTALDQVKLALAADPQ
jgi:type IV pilus assembly protein PilF